MISVKWLLGFNRISLSESDIVEDWKTADYLKILPLMFPVNIKQKQRETEHTRGPQENEKCSLLLNCFSCAAAGLT